MAGENLRPRHPLVGDLIDALSKFDRSTPLAIADTEQKMSPVICLQVVERVSLDTGERKDELVFLCGFSEEYAADMGLKGRVTATGPYLDSTDSVL